MGRMSRYSITSTASSVRFDGCRRVVIRVSSDADVLIAYDPSDFDTGEYFTLLAGSVNTFDPDPITGENLLDGLFYAKTASGTATVEVWLQSQGGRY
jgi:hypothetical protein